MDMMKSKIRKQLPKLIGKGYGDFWRHRGRYRVCKGSRASKTKLQRCGLFRR